ncbi:hypothetical protein [Bradyrhizobium cenepequi]
MKIPRWATGVILAGALTLAIIALIGFAHAYAKGATRCFESFLAAPWPDWIGCAMAAHENLAGGLIGLAGAIFAAWLAYSAVREQLNQAAETAKETARLRVEEKMLEINRNSDELKSAREYLNSFVSHFPPDSAASAWPFTNLLRDLNRRAELYVSESAANAPHGFGRRIHTVMWRLVHLREQSEQEHYKLGDFEPIETEIMRAVASIDQIVAELDDLIPTLDRQTQNLNRQLLNLSG